MFKFIKHIAPRTRILFVTFILILVPGAIISYLSLQSIRQKAENLQTKYNGTVNLIRDKLENEIASLEANLRNNAIEKFPGSDNSVNIKAWLRNVQSDNPAFKNLILINSEGGLITTSISKKWEMSSGAKLLMNTEAAAHFILAERAEFISKNLPDAITHYHEALALSVSPQERALVLSRIGRCRFKLADYTRAIDEYNKILEIPNDEITIGNVPAKVAALSQLADCFEALEDHSAQFNTNIELFRYLIDHPWDLAGGEFLFYLKSAGDEIKNPENTGTLADSSDKINELQERKNSFLEEINYIGSVEKVLPEIITELNKGPSSDLKPHYISGEATDTVFQMSYFRLTVPFGEPVPLALGYQTEKKYLLSDLFPGILGSVELGKDVLVGIIGENDSILYLQNEIPVSQYLATANFSPNFADWKVALFDPGGKSLDQLTGKERQFYLMLFIGIIAVMLIGIMLIVRTVIHESEISRMKSDFVSNVSHELKTPLALIRMFGETLDSGIVTDEKDRQKFYGIIRKESERLSHLINNVLDFSGIDAGVKEYNFREDNIVEVVRNTLETYKFQISDSGFEIESNLPEESINVRIDKEAISQVLFNLFNNAVKYSDREKYLGVEVIKDSASVLITVSDHGAGIPKDELKKIFDKFYRVSDARTKEIPGSGLGLTLVKHIIEAHGGTVEVDSEAGKGSRFTFSIPLGGT